MADSVALNSLRYPSHIRLGETHQTPRFLFFLHHERGVWWAVACCSPITLSVLDPTRNRDVTPQSDDGRK